MLGTPATQTRFGRCKPVSTYVRSLRAFAAGGARTHRRKRSTMTPRNAVEDKESSTQATLNTKNTQVCRPQAWFRKRKRSVRLAYCFGPGDDELFA